MILRLSIWLFSCLGYTNVIFAHEDFVDVIHNVKPFVVKIDAVRKRKLFGSNKNKKRDSALGEYAEFYKDEFKDVTKSSKGSGFVVKGNYGDEYAWVLTAAHVVANTSKIKIVFASGDRKNAELVWSNRRDDVALLKIHDSDLKGRGLSLSSEEMRDGQSVLAIGGALGLPLSSSVGIISAQNVKLKKNGSSLLQTDAAINPGSSGGALFDSKGSVVGLISSIYSKTGTFSGAAFAVPAETLRKLLIKHE